MTFPKDYTRIEPVEMIDALVKPLNSQHVNCRVLERQLKGDFNALARKLLEKNTAGRRLYVDEVAREQKDMDADNADALGIVLADMRAMHPTHNNIVLRVITPAGYKGFDSFVHQYHHDGGDAMFGRVICAYNDPGTHILRNEDAVPIENTSHYRRIHGRHAFTFAAGNIWQFAVSGSRALPLVHSAPRTDHTEPPRLVMVAGYNPNRSR